MYPENMQICQILLNPFGTASAIARGAARNAYFTNTLRYEVNVTIFTSACTHTFSLSLCHFTYGLLVMCWLNNQLHTM